MTVTGQVYQALISCSQRFMQGTDAEAAAVSSDPLAAMLSYIRTPARGPLGRISQ